MFHRMMNYGELEIRPTVVLTKEVIKKHMPKYKRHDDLIIVHADAWEEFKRAMPIPVVTDENSPFSIDEDELASLVCQTVQKPVCRRLAIDRGVKSDGYRTPNVQLILGANGLVNHKDNHILYKFDVTKCMFSFGNVREKMRMAELNCMDEIVVDLFAGIGYFTLPLLIHAQAKHLYACEWNPDAVKALKQNLDLNKVESTRYTVIEGDNRLVRPVNVAQRVILGILPSCMDWMKTALETVDKKTGAILHCHDLVETKPKHVESASPQPSTSAPVADSNSLNGEKVSRNLIDPSSELPVSNSDNANSQSVSDNQSLLNQSLSSSSTSSHSTIEKLSAPLDDLRVSHSSESDKDTSSPVLLEKPSLSSSNTNPSSSNSSSFDTAVSNSSNSNDRASLTSSHEESIIEPPQLSEHEVVNYEARGLTLIESIKSDLHAYNLTARLLYIQPVKSYAPHVNHVVFDIKIEPNEDQIREICHQP